MVTSPAPAIFCSGATQTLFAHSPYIKGHTKQLLVLWHLSSALQSIALTHTKDWQMQDRQHVSLCKELDVNWTENTAPPSVQNRRMFSPIMCLRAPDKLLWLWLEQLMIWFNTTVNSALTSSFLQYILIIAPCRYATVHHCFSATLLAWFSFSLQL